MSESPYQVDDGRPHLIIMVGMPGSGKTSYVLKHLRNTHIRLNLDTIKNRDKERSLFFACLAARVNIVIDNTNMSREERARFLPFAIACGYTTCVVYIDVPVEVCRERSTQRVTNERRNPIPDKAFNGMISRFQMPDKDLEAFDFLYIEKQENVL